MSSYLTHYTEPEKQALKAMLLANFGMFCKFAFRCQTSLKLEFEPHHKVMCEMGQDIIEGKISRAVISIPPRHSKTAFFTVCMIARTYAGCSIAENIQTSFSDNNVKTNAEDIMKILKHPDFIELFGVQIKSVNVEKFTTTTGGKCHNRTSKGAITGVGAGVASYEGFSGVMTLDDMIKPSEARSDTSRNFVNNLYAETLSNRGNTPLIPHILVMQRLHSEDLVGYVLTGNSAEKWHYLNIPAVVTKDTGSISYYNRLCKKYTHAVPYHYQLDIPDLIQRNLTQEYTYNLDINASYDNVEDYVKDTIEQRTRAGRAAIWAKKRDLNYYDSIAKSNPTY